MKIIVKKHGKQLKVALFFDKINMFLRIKSFFLRTF